MESKLIDKIKQDYNAILNMLKGFLKDNFIEAKENTKKYNTFENNILTKKNKEIGKYINEYSKENNILLEKIKNVKKNVYELIKDIISNKNKIIGNSNESLYLVKHPNDCLFLLQIDKYNSDIYNYLNLIYIQIDTHKSDKLESIYFILNNMKITSK